MVPPASSACAAQRGVPAGWQAAASQQVTQSISEISNVTRESSQGAGQMAQAAAALSQRSETLQRMVSQFQV